MDSPTTIKNGEEMIKLNDDPTIYHVEFDPQAEVAPQTWVDSNSTQNKKDLHDSHRCRSATCPICTNDDASSKQVMFFSTYDDDGVEVYDGTMSYCEDLGAE